MKCLVPRAANKAGMVGANAAFFGVLAGEAAIVLTAKLTSIAYLWFNVIGCLVVIVVALSISYATEREPVKSGV